MKASISAAPFGVLPDGSSVELYTLVNANGMTAQIMTYGGIITSLTTPDRSGALGDVVLGYDSLDGYLRKSPYLGAIVGRFANRIAGARFTLDGTTYQLDANKGGNAIHGGPRGFDKVVWHAEPHTSDTDVALVLTHTSPDGDQHYPGTLQVEVTYRLTDANALIVQYNATTDKATIINLTQHSYFNLRGAGNGDVLDHVVQLDASAFTPVNNDIIPTGEIRGVAGTPFDFRTPKRIGADINAADPQLTIAGGYDHNFVIDRNASGDVTFARISEPESGRTMQVATTEPGVQFYTGNSLDGKVVGKGGHAYLRQSAFCLETQHFPDAPNQPAFPPTTLRPGETYRSRTTFTFGVAGTP